MIVCFIQNLVPSSVYPGEQEYSRRRDFQSQPTWVCEQTQTEHSPGPAHTGPTFLVYPMFGESGSETAEARCIILAHTTGKTGRGLQSLVSQALLS